MPKNFEDLPTPEERAERKEILEEMKEVAYSESPRPEEDWDLVWVLSGPEKSAEDASKHGKRNETRDRLKTGFVIASRVAALKTGKNLREITVEDILSCGPDVFFNGTDEQNDDLRQFIERDDFKKLGFPAKKIIISDNMDLKHTGDQFDKIPDEILEGKRKVVIVSSLRHLPRVKRYVDKHKEKFPEKPVLYPAEPRNTPVGATLREIKKISEYRKKGILPNKEEK